MGSGLRLRLVATGYPWMLFRGADAEPNFVDELGQALWKDVCDLSGAAESVFGSVTLGAVSVGAPPGCGDAATQFDLQLSCPPARCSEVEHTLVLALYQTTGGPAAGATLTRLSNVLRGRYGVSFGTAVLDPARSVIRASDTEAAAASVPHATAAAQTPSAVPAAATAPPVLGARPCAPMLVPPPSAFPAAIPPPAASAAAAAGIASPPHLVPPPPGAVEDPRLFSHSGGLGQPPAGGAAPPPAGGDAGFWQRRCDAQAAEIAELRAALQGQAELLLSRGQGGDAAAAAAAAAAPSASSSPTLLAEKKALQWQCEQLRKENAQLAERAEESEAALRRLQGAELPTPAAAAPPAVAATAAATPAPGGGGRLIMHPSAPPPRPGSSSPPVPAARAERQRAQEAVALRAAREPPLLAAASPPDETQRQLRELQELRRLRQRLEAGSPEAASPKAGSGRLSTGRFGAAAAAARSPRQQGAAAAAAAASARTPLSTPARKAVQPSQGTPRAAAGVARKTAGVKGFMSSTRRL